MKARIKVVIVDDHPLFRSGTAAGEWNPIHALRLAEETGDGATALRLILEQKPEVAVLDVNIPGHTGLEIAQALQAKKSPTRVIILTMHKEEALINRALDFGVKGFVLKENAAENILDAIKAVAAGEHYLSPEVSGHLVRRHSRAEKLAAQKPGLDDLTKAERRILKLIAQKKTSREIAAELYISTRTVEAHRANISAKLELRGSHSLLQFALENRSSL